MPGSHRSTRIGSLTRFGTISRILFRHGFASLFDRRERGTDDAAGPAVRAPWPGFPSPVRLRRAFEELGPSFIKLGQLLSLRADLLPRPYIEELRRLQDRVPPVAFDRVRPVIETDLGRPLEEVFAEFQPASMAAASVAQVHRARLPDGTDVAVKIIRPGIEKKIREDIDLMYRFATRFERRSELGRIVGLVNVVREFERTIFRELDMFIEAGSIEKFAANFADSEEIVIPRVHWEATGRSVLTMDYMPGIKMDEVAAIRGAGLDPREIARIGLRSFSRQLLEFGFFHADPHPANTIVMADGRVALVDFGITGYLDEETMGQVAAVFLGYARRDYGLVIDALLDAGLIDDQMDLAALRADLKDMSEVFYGRTLATIQVKDVYDQVMDLAYRYGIRFPRNLLLLFKTLIQTEALGKILESRDSLLEAVAPQARRLLRHGVKTRARIREEVRHLGRDAASLPRHLAAILRNTVAGRQAFELRHTGFEGLDGKIEKGVNRLTVGLIIAASTIAAALILNSGREVLVLDLAFLGLPAISLTGLLGLTGYTIATVLGVWLIISIVRSGRL
ncbi:MAG: AarF/UbiB family protein [Desulfosarcinaceae bacterium]|jgi:ubiquinone biosynthesis protein